MANPFVHVELSTDNVEKASKFYKKLFNWKLSKSPAMDYTMIDTGSKHTGGGLQMHPMPGAPPMWLTYVEVKSVKQTLTKAKQNGGKVLMDYQPIPGMGGIGIFSDPSGAALGVWETGKKPARKAKR